MPLQPGEIIEGKYRIVRILGEGGMGAVYEGENMRIKRTVAIKVLHSQVATKADVVKRFEREAQAAGRIGSEHIVEVVDLGNLPSGERYMVMEYLAGEDLTTRIKRRKRLTVEETVPILHQILEGLGAAHEAEIVHRDLKPDNIFLLTKYGGRRDFVKVLDFGVSKFNTLDDEMGMTRAGAVMGTPYYMSPEQAKGGAVDGRSDLYAIGVVTYQMLTGRVPFNASSFNELLFKIALESPEPIENIVPDIPSAFAAIVARAMARDPSQRFQSAREFQDAVAKFQMMNAPAGNTGFPHIPGTHVPTPTHSDPGGMLTPAAGVPIPGTHTPAHGLMTSQAALAVTQAPNGKGTVMVALAVVAFTILAVGGAGAYLLSRPMPAAPVQGGPATTVIKTVIVTHTVAPEPPPAPSSEPTAEATASATTPSPPRPTIRRPGPKPKPKTEEPKPAPAPAPVPTAKPGGINEDL